MSTTYRTVAGDTFATVARKTYGTEKEATRLAKANPGTDEPIPSGTVLFVPQQDVFAPSTSSENADEVAVFIDGERFRFWETVTITRSLDTFDTIELSAPFEAGNASFRQTFRPLSYKPLSVTVGGSPLFTGTMVGVEPSLSSKQKTVVVTGYALPGVLNDCTPPAASFGAYQLEYNQQTLEQIAADIISPFGLTVESTGETGTPFERVSCGTGKTVLAFLTELARQRGRVLSNTELGALLVRTAAGAGQPVAQLRQGEPPLLTAKPTFDAQQYYSHITGIEPVVLGLSGSQFTVKNDRLTQAVRPHTFDASDTQDATVKTVVEAKAGRMFANAVTYECTASTWRDSGGQLWRPNTTLGLDAPDAMVYNGYEFLVRSVQFSATRTNRTAALGLVLPGAFNNEAPEALPWDE